MTKNILLCCFGVIVSSLYAGQAEQFTPYTWNRNTLPEGKSVPYLYTYEDYAALKNWKYLEAYIELSKDESQQFSFSQSFTIASVVQLSKSWPMSASVISKWDYIDGEASYELGILPDSRPYLRVSESGNTEEQVTTITSAQQLERGRPYTVVAVFDARKKMELYVNGKLTAQRTPDFQL